MDDNKKEDNSDLLQYLKENPDLHQKILDQKMQANMGSEEKPKDGNIFDYQASNPAVKQDYKNAEFNSSPWGQAVNKAEQYAKDSMASGGPIAMGGVTKAAAPIAEEAASIMGKPLTGLAKRGLREGIQFAKEPVAGNFGKVIMKDSASPEGTNLIKEVLSGENPGTQLNLVRGDRGYGKILNLLKNQK